MATAVPSSVVAAAPVVAADGAYALLELQLPAGTAIPPLANGGTTVLTVLRGAVEVMCVDGRRPPESASRSYSAPTSRAAPPRRRGSARRPCTRAPTLAARTAPRCAEPTGGRTRVRSSPRRGTLAGRAGSVALVARATEELVLAGGRPRRTALGGVESLTPSERRVAEHAASGLTNREIAEALFITRKTVEYTLGRAFVKLDVKSRTQLAGRFD